ncbi:transcription initiation protein spt4 [Earliella scabrosa]|nr:transcription initiation protein spt4 [Earliella scabrosa]
MSQVQASIPSQPRAKQLRACLLCSIIQTPADFRKHGCPNCEELMQMKGYADRIQSCTTTHFEGVIAVINPEDSWVARWQRTCVYGFIRVVRTFLTVCVTAKYVRGMYAVRVKGRIPEDVETELEQRNIKYRPRDGTDQD